MATPTFQQILDKTGDNIDGADIKPNTLHPAEIVFEPAHEGAKFLSVRDAQHKPLMAFVVCREHIGLIHSTVALYPSLYELLKKEIPPEGKGTATIEETEKALNELEKAIVWLRENLYVVQEKQATAERRNDILNLAQSIELTINEIAATLEMKPKENENGFFNELYPCNKIIEQLNVKINKIKRYEEKIIKKSKSYPINSNKIIQDIIQVLIHFREFEISNFSSILDEQIQKLKRDIKLLENDNKEDDDD